MKVINLRDFKPASLTVFTGRPQGEEVRRSLNLNELDSNSNILVKVIIPKETTSFNPSFFLGLFYPSIKFLKSIENFQKKYSLEIESEDNLSQSVLQRNIQDGFRNAQNSLNKKTGLSAFF